MPPAYDPNNVFAKILRGEIPCKKVHESDHALAFHDVAPKAPVHVLVIPKGPFLGWDDFAERASDAEMAGFVRAIGEAARITGASAEGYRLIANIGENGGQEVPHLHVHLIGGRRIGRMLPND